MTLWITARQAHLSMGILQARILEWVTISFFRGSSLTTDHSNPGIEPVSPVSPALQADSICAEPSGKPQEDLRRSAKPEGQGQKDTLFLGFQEGKLGGRKISGRKRKGVCNILKRKK